MFIGVGTSVPEISNLPGSSRPGGGGGGAFEYTAIDNSFSMEFDGAQSYFNITDEILGGATSFTISCWYYSDSFANDRTILGKWTGLSPTKILLYHDNPNGWRILFRTTSGGNKAFQSTLTGTTGVWQHLVCKFDGSDIKFYINGSTTESSTVGSATVENIGNMYIGADVGANRYWDGNLDEFAIWTTALSDETVQAIYDTTANNPGKVADLSETPEGAPTAWYRMGD